MYFILFWPKCAILETAVRYISQRCAVNTTAFNELVTVLSNDISMLRHNRKAALQTACRVV